MRVLCFLTVLASFACAQNEKTIYTTDLSGNRVASAMNENTENSHRELSQSVNGRTVPLEATDTRIISKSGNRTVTETITKKFNPNGGLGSTERLVTETESLPNGGKNQTLHYYGSDVSGETTEFERRQVQERVQGSSRTTDTVIARPGLSGAFETTEKRTAKTDVAGARTETNETVYRVSQNGESVPGSTTGENPDPHQQNHRDGTSSSLRTRPHRENSACQPDRVHQRHRRRGKCYERSKSICRFNRWNRPGSRRAPANQRAADRDPPYWRGRQGDRITKRTASNTCRPWAPGKPAGHFRDRLHGQL